MNIVTEDILRAVALASIAAIAGFLVRQFLIPVNTIIRAKLMEMQGNWWKRNFNAKKVYLWLIKYYLERDQIDTLYTVTKLGNPPVLIPILTKPNWHSNPLEPDSVVFLPNPEVESEVKVQEKIIRRRRSMDQRLSDDRLFPLAELHEDPKGISVELGKCTYFQYVTSCVPLEEETIKAIKFPVLSTQYRNKYASSIDALLKFPFKSQAIGVHAVIGFKTHNSYDILLQERGYETLGYGGSFAVTPSFLMGAITLSDQRNEATLFHNFLREYYEELFNNEEVMQSSKRLSYDWFYEDPIISDLLSIRKTGTLKIEFLGLGFDALWGDVNVALFVRIEDIEFLDQRISRMESNWEAMRIKRLDIKSPTLSNLLHDRKLHPGSAFAIDQAVKRLESLGSKTLD